MKNLYICLALLLIATSVSCSGEKSGDQKTAKTQQESSDKLLKNVDAEGINEIISSYKGGKAVLVNIWATWCMPCVEEFPEIVDIQEKYPEQLQVIFVSADFPEQRDKAKEFLKEHNVDWTTYFKDAKDEPFINALSKDWSGALPFTKIISTSGEEIAHWENKASFDKFNKHVQQAIKP